jgi:hypothetical protein
MSIFWKVTVSVILSKIVYMYMRSIPNGFRDRAISLYSTLHTVQTSNTPCPHTSCRVHWCRRWNFRKCIIVDKLYQLWELLVFGLFHRPVRWIKSKNPVILCAIHHRQNPLESTCTLVTWTINAGIRNSTLIYLSSQFWKCTVKWLYLWNRSE